jgi:hypothetical protein
MLVFPFFYRAFTLVTRMRSAIFIAPSLNCQS